MTVDAARKAAVIIFIWILWLEIVQAREGRHVRSDIPPAVLWGLSLYGGGVEPLGPFDFTDFWCRGFSVSLEGDILLKNDMVLGLSLGYARLPMNIRRFSQAKGISKDNVPPEGLAVGISQLLLSFKGFEDYLLYPYKVGYEMGGGLYSMSNTQIYVEYWGTEVRAVSERIATAAGAFAGLSLNFLVSETLQVAVKSRFHYVFLPGTPHQLADLLLGFTML